MTTRKEEEDALDAVLTDGRLSGREKDELFARVTASRRMARPARRYLWAAFALAPALGAVLLFVLPRDEAFRARGGAPVAIIDYACLPGPSCTAGGRLVFTVTALGEDALLSAYADGPSGERVWFFPTASGEAPHVRAALDRQVVSQGAVLADMRAGRWQLHAVLSRAQLARDDVVAGTDALSALHATLVVAP